MNKLFQINEYLSYLLHAKGMHKMHSPFVFDFMKNVLYDHRNFYAYEEIEKLRSRVQASEQEIDFTDYGTGSNSSLSGRRRIGAIAKTALKPARYAQLL